MKALVGAFNQEKALVGAFSVIVKTGCGTNGSICGTTLNLVLAGWLLVAGVYLVAEQLYVGPRPPQRHRLLQHLRRALLILGTVRVRTVAESSLPPGNIFLQIKYFFH